MNVLKHDIMVERTPEEVDWLVMASRNLLYISLCSVD